MKNAGESWKYTSILLNSNDRQYLETIKDGSGEPIDIFKCSSVQRTTISQVCKDENISVEDAYKKYFTKIFSDTNAQSSIRTKIIETVKHLGPNEMLEVEYVPHSGKSKDNKVTHHYISNTVRRVIWLSDVAEINDDQIIKKENPDITHFPHFNVPVTFPGKFIVTIHDLLMHKNVGLAATTLIPPLYFVKRLGYKTIFR